MDVYQIVMGFLPQLDDSLRVTPTDESIALGENTTFTVVVSLRIGRGLCEGTFGSSFLVAKLKDLLTRRIGSWVPGFDNALRAARYQRDKLDWFFQRVYDSILFLVSRIVEITRADQAFGWLAERVCEALIGEGGTAIDPDLELPPASTIHTASCFLPESDGSYTCTEECADEDVTISARATFCGREIIATGRASVRCEGCRSTCEGGCCDDQTCVTFDAQDDDRCGAAFAACAACAPREACEDGVCVCQSTCSAADAASAALRCVGTVPERCETVEAGCHRWVAQRDCAEYGATCDAESGECAGGCGPHNCALGCCRVVGEEHTCLGAADEQSDSECGFDGATCRACTEDEACSGGVCRCRVPGGCEPIPFGGGGRSWGDPHLVTHDGGAFDFQGLGDFVLVRATDGDDDFMVQSRHRHFESACDGVSVNGAVAMRWRGQVVEVDYETPEVVTVDASTVPLEDGETIFLADGLSVSRYGFDYWAIEVADGPALYVVNQGRYLDLSVDLPATYAGAVEGLLGDFDGAWENDRMRFEGVPLELPALEADSDAAAETWATVASPASHPLVGLFGSARPDDGPHTERCRLSDLDETAREAARATCEAAGVSDPTLLALCTFDVAFGDEDFAETYALLPGGYRLMPSVRPLALGPGDFTSIPAGAWAYLVEGEPDLGAFVTFGGADGLSFFVSEDSFGDATFFGTIQFPEPGFDDNYGGLVFGFEGPAAGIDERVVTYLVAFNGHPSTYPGGEAVSPDGIALVSVDRDFDDLEPGFWAQESSEEYAVWASSFGEGLGWTGGPPDPEDGHVGLFTYEFVLESRSDRIRLHLEATRGDAGNPLYDGSVVFELEPSDVGLSEFRTGRFGFYGLHQPIFATYEVFVAEE